MPQFDGFVYWAFCGVLSFCALSIAKSINELNTKMSMLLEKMEWHEKELGRHSVRLDSLEDKK